MKYSFLLPAYKERFLREALSSILSQSVSDFEIIVSDDASEEPIKRIVEEFRDPRIRYRRNESNIGAKMLVEHWNLLLEQAKGDFIIIASDDDSYDRRFLFEIDKLIDKYSELDLYRTRSQVIDSAGGILRKEISIKPFLDFKEFCRFLADPQCVLCIGNYAFRTESLRKKGGFVNFPYAWKSDSATEMLLATNGLATTEDILFSFRRSGSSISSRQETEESKKGKTEAIILFKEWSDNLFTSHGMNEESIRKDISRKLEGEIRAYVDVLPARQFWELYKKMIREEWFYSARNGASFLLDRLLKR